jgi:uncharacterized glyoxalase superfamily protein PhnB
MPDLSPISKSTIIPSLRYRNAPAAIDWLCQVFGLARHAVYPGPGNTIGHAELTLGGGMIMLGSQKDDAHSERFKSPEEAGFETRGAYIVTPEVDLVYARAKAAGGTIIRELQSTEYGSREFAVKDPEGHTWSVGTYDPWVQPAK